MGLARRAGLTAVASAALAPRGCLFIFHRVAPTKDWAARPNRGFHIDADFLGRLIDYLRHAGWDIVSMDEALRRVGDGSDARRFVNFSIDDTYRDTGEFAVPLFRGRGAPVTLFVTTGIPDGTLPLWQAGLETIIQERDSIALPGGARISARSAAAKRRLFSALAETWEQADAARLYGEVCERNGFAQDALRARHAMTWPMLETLRNDPLVEIGGHTISHPRLSGLSDADAGHEIAGCRARLQARLGLPVRHFAFPFGRAGDCGAREFALAARAGFASAVTTRRGVIAGTAAPALHALPRNTLNGTHRRIGQAEAHLSGLTGLAARLLDRAASARPLAAERA